MASFKSLSKLALLGLANALPSVEPREPDNTQPVGTNPVKATVQYLGLQHSDNSCNRRDLGFAGHIQGKWYGVYGDNLGCPSGVNQPEDWDGKSFSSFVRDSVATLGNNPLLVHDNNLLNGHPQQFVPWISYWNETAQTGFGGTSIVETDWNSATGAVYYLINQNEHYDHAGICKVQIQNGQPRAIQRYDFNTGSGWDTKKTAAWGDITAYRDERSDYIYLLGHPPAGNDNNYHYQARVKAQDAFDLSKYQYWWGRAQGWKSDLLTVFNKETAVMWGAGQGSMVYSNYYNCYFYVHLAPFNGPVMIKTAPSPEGPWSESKSIWQGKVRDNGFMYAGVVYPYLDPSSQTLTIAYTNNNLIEVIKATFSK